MDGERVRWGVIGCAGIALTRTIPEGFLPARNAELAAVLNRTAETTADVARRFSVKPAADVDGLLASGIDAVYVASPVYLHREHVLRSVAAGKHVLCEKPLALSVEEAGEMTAAARARGVQLGTAFMMRFHAQHRAALDLIRRGRLGQPVFARAQLGFWYPKTERAWRQNPALAGGGSLADVGSHLLDLLEMFFGPIAQVTCFTANAIHEYASEDGAVAALRFANGALGSIDAFFAMAAGTSRNVLELYGSRGSILASGTIGQESGGSMTACLRPDETGAVENIAIAPDEINFYRAEIEEFSAALLEGTPSLLAGESGLRNQRLLAACYESARTGRAVALD
jgi:predicted dehydrogenase